MLGLRSLSFGALRVVEFRFSALEKDLCWVLRSFSFGALVKGC